MSNTNSQFDIYLKYKNLSDFKHFSHLSRTRYLKKTFYQYMEIASDPSNIGFPPEILTERQRAVDEKAIINSITLYDDTVNYIIENYFNNDLTDNTKWELINLTIEF